MNIRPTGNRVLVRRAPKQTQTPGGLYIPETVEENGSVEAHVLNIGRDVKDVNTGDTVLVPRYGGLEIKVDEETLVIFQADEILGVVGE